MGGARDYRLPLDLLIFVIMDFDDGFKLNINMNIKNYVKHYLKEVLIVNIVSTSFLINIRP